MASVVVTMSADDARLWRAQQRIFEQQLKLNEKLGDGGRKAKAAADLVVSANEKAAKSFGKIGEALDKNLGQGTSAKVQDYVTNIATVATTVATITKAWTDAKQAQEDAIRSLNAKGDSERRLVQIATDARDLQAMTKQASDLSTKFGVDTATVNKVIFEGRSMNFSEFVPELIASNQVVDPNAAATVAGKVPTLFAGSGLTPEQAVSMNLLAAKTSNADFEQMAGAIPTVAQGSAIAGASPEEAYAALSVFASKFGSVGEAATNLRGFTTATGINEKFAGRNLGVLGIYNELKGMSEKDRKSVLGESQELNVGYKLLDELNGQIAELAGVLKANRQADAKGTGFLDRQRAIADADPRMQARMKIARSELALETAKEFNNAIEGVDRVAAENAAKTATEKARLTMFERFMNNNLLGPMMADMGASASVTKSSHLALLNISPRRTLGMLSDAVQGYGGNQAARARFEETTGQPLPFTASVKVEGAAELEAAAKKINQAADKLNQRVGPSVDTIRRQAGAAGQ